VHGHQRQAGLLIGTPTTGEKPISKSRRNIRRLFAWLR
jgi:hypothetical protein